MKTTKKMIAGVAVLLFVGAGVAWHRSQQIIRQYRWIALEQPIQLEEGFSSSHAFTVDVPARYWVQVECRKTVPFETLDQTLRKKLAAEFVVTSGAEPITFGDTSRELGMLYTAQSISRHIGTFEAAPGIQYNLGLRITAGLPEIASTQPTVKVSVEPIAFKKAFMSASLAAYIALGFALFGLLCIVLLAWAFLFQRADNNTLNA